jgi:hypothetical protein
MHPVAEFRRCADAPVDEAIPQLNLPHIMKVLRIELGTDDTSTTKASPVRHTSSSAKGQSIAFG